MRLVQLWSPKNSLHILRCHRQQQQFGKMNEAPDNGIEKIIEALAEAIRHNNKYSVLRRLDTMSKFPVAKHVLISSGAGR